MMSRYPRREYRRYQRRSWRRNNYPVMLIGTGEPLASIATAALARWACRHRSAFLPFAVMTAEFVVAAILHPHHQRSWIITLVATACACIILGMPHRLLWAHPSMKLAARIMTRAWEACGIDRAAERAYVTAVITACGGWLTAAIAAGPGTKPLPAIAITATVLLGIPWWAHRRRRARVRATRTIQAWPQLSESIGLPGSRISGIVVDTWGWTARVMLKKGTTAAHAVSQVPAIESGLGIRPGAARITPDTDRADRISLRVIEKDPHADPIPWREPASDSITSPIALGITEDGTTTAALVLRRNVLIAGTTGAGKSGVENDIVAALAKCGDSHRWGIGLKGGMELQPWTQCLHRPLATTSDAATGLLTDAIAELERRAALLARLGLRAWEPTPAAPALSVVIDEYAELPAEALDRADSIARRGRAVAVNLIIATQRPSQAAMGGNAVRSQMDVRICLRVRERRDTDLILGQGSLATGWDAHALTQPGTFLLSDPEHATPRPARAYLITDAQIAAHAARYAITPRTRASGAEPPRERAEQPPANGCDPRSRPSPASALWDALHQAGPDGASIGDLITATGMTRPTLYRHLRAHADAGRAAQSARGRWRAIGD